MPDTNLHELFTPLREAESTQDAAAIAARRRRPRARYVIALPAVVGAAVLGILAAPATDPTTPSGPSTGPGVLRAAAAVAADQPPLPASEGYRYIRELQRTTFSTSADGRGATLVVERPVETWENAELKGRRAYGKGHVLAREGPPELIERLTRDAQGYKVFDEYELDAAIEGDADGPRPKPSELPTEPDRLRRALEEHYIGRSHWRRGLPTPAMVQRGVTGRATWLLTSASAGPQLRAAVYEMLATMPNSRSLGSVQDPQGRTGRGVALEIRSDDHRFVQSSERRLVIDPDTAEVLSTSGRLLDPEGPYVGGEGVITATAQVSAIGERP